ncbi:Transaminase [Aspergillus mulundensis]|uniref:Transaminase n=1 Tax=Aspergillus mulundensis TaxID=1810919 RepID=A0A3D8SBS0_9EURO|nr:Transaminase [Aspergillus mulundensis]RDW83770.1 Transaminase [Aspergillus mulundensis]
MGATEYPRPPVAGLDWNNLGFEPVEGTLYLQPNLFSHSPQIPPILTLSFHAVNGHIESRFTPSTNTWSPPTFVADPHIRIHGLTPALNYGQQIFEGLKAFRTRSGRITLFRPDQNAARFARSARAVSIPPVPSHIFLEAVHAAVAMNSEFVPPLGSGAALYIRPLAFASSATVGLKLAGEFLFCVYVLPVAGLHRPLPVHEGGDKETSVSGVKALVVEDFDRAAPLGTGDVKVGGNYGPVLGRIDAARQEGYGLTLHLDSLSHSVVDEFSTSGFVGVRRGTGDGDGGQVTLVVSDSQQIVASVTIDSVCEIARGLGWAVEKRPIAFTEVSEFVEVYAAGTAAMLVPVQSVERRSTGEVIHYSTDYADPTSVFAQLYKALSGVQQGLVPDQWGWTQEVLWPKQLDSQD